MILGTANFLNEYRGLRLNEDQCIEIMDAFIAHGGKIVDTADNYGGARAFLMDRYCDKVEILTKFRYEYTDIPSKNDIILDIYYPHEIKTGYDYISIPNSDIFKPYIDIMKLHSKVLVRSVYRLDSDIWKQAYDVIVGVENIQQLLENMEKFKCKNI